MRNLYEATCFSVDNIYVQCQIDDLIKITESKSRSTGDLENDKRKIVIENESFVMTFIMTEKDKRKGCSAHYYKLSEYVKTKTPKQGDKVILSVSMPNNRNYKHGTVCNVVSYDLPTDTCVLQRDKFTDPIELESTYILVF